MSEFLETEQEWDDTADEREPVVLGQPMMSGHCAFPQTAHPEESHDRCGRNGAGSRANPRKVFGPCPCWCHLGEQYECGNCGRIVAEAPRWNGTGEMTYVHIDSDGNSIGEDCS